MSDMIMYPLNMRKRARLMLEELDSMDKKIVEFFEEYATVEDEGRLSGKAWSSVKSYIADVQKPYLRGYKAWQIAQRDALKIYDSAAQNLPDVNKLDECQMNNRIRNALISIRRQKHKKPSNQCIIKYYEKLIEELREKIKKMYEFRFITLGIFEEADYIQSVLISVRSSLRKVELPKQRTIIKYTSIMENEKMKELIVIANIQYMIDSGVSKKRLTKLEDLGFGKRRLSNIYEMSKAEGEKDLIIHFIKGNYKEAFQTVNRDKGFAGSTATFIVEYLYSLGKNKNTDRKIEKIIKAIFEEKEDVVDINRAVACALSLQATTKKLIETDCIYLMTEGRYTSDEEYKELGNRLEKFNAMDGLYGSIASIMSDASLGYQYCRFNLTNISDLKYDSGRGIYYYHIKYNGTGRIDDDYNVGKFTPPYTLALDSDVETFIEKDSHAIARYMDHEYLKELNFKRDTLMIDVVDDMIFAVSSTAPTTVIGGTGMAAISIKKALSGSYSKLRNTSMDMLKSTELFSKLPVDFIGVAKGLMIVSQDYQDKKKMLDEVTGNIMESEKASLLYTGNGYVIKDTGVKKIISSGVYSLDTAGALETWLYAEANIKDHGMRDLTLGHLIKDTDILDQDAIDGFEKSLDEQIEKEKAEGNVSKYMKLKELKDVWDGNIDIDKIPINNLYDNIDELSRLVNDYKYETTGKNFDIRLGDAVSSYKQERRYYEDKFK